jgi:hypothetical protein
LVGWGSIYLFDLQDLHCRSRIGVEFSSLSLELGSTHPSCPSGSGPSPGEEAGPQKLSVQIKIWSFLLKLFQDYFDLTLQFWDVVFDNRPDQIRVHLEVAVDQNVAHSHDLLPWHLAVFVFELRRDGPSSLADHLKVMNDPALNKLIAFEGLAPFGGVFLDSILGI